MLKYVFLLSVIFFAFEQCENPIQAVSSITVHHSQVIMEAKQNEVYSEIAVSPKGGQIALVVKQISLNADSGQISNVTSVPFYAKVKQTLRQPASLLSESSFQQACSSPDKSVRKFQTKILVFSHLSDTKVIYQFKFSKDTIQNIDWSPDGQKLLFLENNQVFIFNVQNGKRDTLSVPFSHHLSVIRWGPSENDLSFLIPNGTHIRLGIYSLKTNVSKILDIDLPNGIKDFCWAIRSSKIAFTIPEASEILIFKYKREKLLLDKQFHIDVRSFRWQQGNPVLRKKIGDYAIVKGHNTLGIFYADVNQFNWLSELSSENILDINWAPDGKSIFYIYKQSRTKFKIINEQIIYTNE